MQSQTNTLREKLDEPGRGASADSCNNVPRGPELQEDTHTQTHTYLLIVAQLIVQDDAIGLLGLWPRQCEAIHGGADLVHDGNY